MKNFLLSLDEKEFEISTRLDFQRGPVADPG